jgi:hypothetical protein
LTVTYPAAHGSEFDEFLYASIAEEHNGTLLSVLSALARMNLDPWDEAARLAGLPRAAARQWLTTLIAAIPEGPVPRSDPGVLVEHLIALLPRRAAPAAEPARVSPAVTPPAARASSRTRTITWALYIAAILFMVISQWLMRHPSHTTPPGQATTVVPGTGSTHAPADRSTPSGD